MPYIACDAFERASPWLTGLCQRALDLREDFPMTIEILYLTAEIERWLNRRIARHLAAQVEKLSAERQRR